MSAGSGVMADVCVAVEKRYGRRWRGMEERLKRVRRVSPAQPARPEAISLSFPPSLFLHVTLYG